jgi:hypothetical protein
VTIVHLWLGSREIWRISLHPALTPSPTARRSRSDDKPAASEVPGLPRRWKFRDALPPPKMRARLNETARQNAETARRIADANDDKLDKDELRALDAELHPGAPGERGRHADVEKRLNRWYYELPLSERCKTVYALAIEYLNTGKPGSRSRVTTILSALKQRDRPEED